MELDFSSVYEKHYDKLFSVAYRLTGRKEDAEDVLQEAFLNAFKAYPNFKEKSLISTWLYKIVVNCSYRYIKVRKKLPVVDIASGLKLSESEFFEMLRSYEGVEDVVLTNDMRETCLQLFLKCIPKKQRIAFVLKVLLGIKSEDVAEIMGISVGAVKTNVYRARLCMKDNMEDKCSFINPNYPCRCKNWVAYAIKNNRMELIPRVVPEKNMNYEKIFERDMDFLTRIIMLYNNDPVKKPYKEFISSIKEMISNNSLELLS